MKQEIEKLTASRSKAMGLDTNCEYRVKTMADGSRYVEKRQPGRFGARATWVVVKLIQE